ncbi:MAG: aa3-type cytochrome c oxidase subunit IV [Altererythrobacter sp.]|nr:aa3-type cytochrome c oxidase subunit IV [Altererythrobacter sp.]
MESANNLKAHEKTYLGFVEMLKWAVPAIAVISFIVILLIS